MVIAYRGEATLLDLSLGYDDHYTGAVGGYGVYIADLDTTLIGIHLSLLSKKRQIAQRKRLVEVIRAEKAKGRQVIAVGDFNQDPWKIRRELEPLGLSVTTARSCPAIPWMPAIRSLDQCWLDHARYASTRQYMLRSHSDHYAQITDIVVR
jgi:endonuclease/exonuclease/phosphatase family metal-dependent hydrolase